MGPCLKSYLSYKFDRSETVRDRAKMNLAGHRVRRLFGNYFEPCFPVREVLGHALPENFEILYSCRYIFLHSEEHFKVALLYIDKMFLLACWTTSG